MHHYSTSPNLSPRVVASDESVAYVATLRPSYGYRKLMAYVRHLGWSTTERQVRRVLRTSRAGEM